ncbi:MAG: DUF2075 domain-containing protein [Betaproteobacteria bacterium]
MTIQPINNYSRAWYQAPIDGFLRSDPKTVLGQLAERGEFDLVLSQRDAWLVEITTLRGELKGLTGTLLLEYSIPRMGSRIDAVLVVGPAVFVIEFKVGATAFERSALNQVWDYALDLKNFHAESHHLPIVPILVATAAASLTNQSVTFDHDRVCRPLHSSAKSLRQTIDLALKEIHGNRLDADIWANGIYRPTPTIVEAARALYSQHSVEAINLFDAGKQNLRSTSRRIEELVDEASRTGRKTICFVTGVPGAGKTLVGLNIATLHREESEPTHAVFLSGNGPLVNVLREALTRDEVARGKKNGQKVSKTKAGQKVKAFIQNIHHFRDEALKSEEAPDEHVVIFDEAQRAWNLRQTAAFMQRKRNRPNFDQSEPEFLISYLNRHTDWAVIVCLVGGGQEIYVGEAGIGAWFDAIDKSFKDWHVYVSSRLTDSEYAAGGALARIKRKKNIHFEDDLHLAVSMRSFRAEHVSSFVKAMLDCEVEAARKVFEQISRQYPIVITRDLRAAKEWIRSKARGSERFGVVASSKAMRLRPHALDIRVSIDPVQWFLNDKDDIRSSDFLEDAATEFQVQGLELDWACVTWDGDLRFTGSDWSFHDFRGSKWTKVLSAENKAYLRNAYRVLLTRARQGMVIFVPPGENGDQTRQTGFYDPTYDYLVSLGLPVLS